MTIDEAIIHCDEVIQKCSYICDNAMFNDVKDKTLKCANDHLQLAEWLRELKERKDKSDIIRCNDCAKRNTTDCPMYFEEWIEYDDDGYLEHDYIIHDNTVDDGFCDRGEREDNE